MPIWWTSTPGIDEKSRMRKRELHPLSRRSRYLRWSTGWKGQTRPLTIRVLPKNSGFHTGATPLSGTKGPSKPSKNARVSG